MEDIKKELLNSDSIEVTISSSTLMKILDTIDKQSRLIDIQSKEIGKLKDICKLLWKRGHLHRDSIKELQKAVIQLQDCEIERLK